jgi:hypothetical protein
MPSSAAPLRTTRVPERTLVHGLKRVWLLSIAALMRQMTRCRIQNSCDNMNRERLGCDRRSSRTVNDSVPHTERESRVAHRHRDAGHGRLVRLGRKRCMRHRYHV